MNIGTRSLGEHRDGSVTCLVYRNPSIFEQRSPQPVMFATRSLLEAQAAVTRGNPPQPNDPLPCSNTFSCGSTPGILSTSGTIEASSTGSCVLLPLGAGRKAFSSRSAGPNTSLMK